MSETPTQSNTEKYSFIIAVCAILISAASFYATYLQADSAEKQVKAMTLPIIQYSHSNYDTAGEKRSLYFVLSNAGIGPALIKSVSFDYEGQQYNSLFGVLNTCCSEELEQFRQLTREEGELGIITSGVQNTVIPGQSSRKFFTLDFAPGNAPVWEALNNERWKVNAEVCFCSLLEECYVARGVDDVTEVEACPTAVN